MAPAIIVAVSENGVIGVANTLPWHLPADLQYFKKVTSGHPILMGRNTYESIGRPLPNRENLVVSRQADFKPEGVTVFSSLEAALAYTVTLPLKTFIIGGDRIYQQTRDMADVLHLTRVHTHIENGEAFFAEPEADQWTLVEETFRAADEKNAFDCTFLVYHRVKHA
ncbi:MAG: dihydrofolate reductase [Chitinophagaceae bacterium]